MAQINKIKIRRGLNASLPTGGTEAGELRYSTDTQELYVDDGSSNVKVASQSAASGAVSTAQAAADAAVLASATAADTTVLTSATGRAIAFSIALG